MIKKLHFSVLIAFSLAIQFTVSGQVGSFKCTEVMPNGDVLLHWQATGVGSDVNSYTIYYSSNLTGPYSILTVITIVSLDNYLHTGAGANFAPLYYYLITNTVSGPTPPSDTLATMLLSASTLDNEIIDLSWTNLHFQPPFLPDMHPWYLLYREYLPGNWIVLDSTQDLNITHHFWPCNGNSDTVRFKIGVRDDNFGCISFSSQKGEVLRNLSNRFPPQIDSVSIDAGGKAIIGWQPGLEPDIVGYKIFSVTATNDSIDYVDGRFTTSYQHLSSDPCNGPLRYIILSIDSCGNESPFPFVPEPPFPDKPQSTIYLSDILYDPCLMTNTLGWNEYINFEPPLEYTNIYVSENNGPYSFLETILPGQVEYTHSNLLPNTTYSYYVRAVSQDHAKSSTSCRKEVTTYNSPRPLFMYTRYVTVEDNDHVNIRFYTDTNAHVQSYRILRSTSESGPYEEAGTIQEEGSEFISFTDIEADVTSESYYYQIEVVDSCGLHSIIANTCRTIFLETEALPDLSNPLTWNAYESWYGQVHGYKVYRRLDNSSLDLLADLDSLSLTYTDNVSDLIGSANKITYLVEAYEGNTNPYGFRESSFSNEILSEQVPKVYLPNAFMPMGLNNLFKPVIVFVGSEGYEFIIYNRWGQLVFKSDTPEEGWNGTYNGDYVPQDVYIYLLRFRNALNQSLQIKGNVAVIY